MATKKVDTQSFQSDVLDNGKPVVVDFWAEWSGPCKMIGPSLEEISEEMADIAIYLFLMAADAGIDLGQAMQAKLATNEKRYPADPARGRHNKYTDYQPDDE